MNPIELLIAAISSGAITSLITNIVGARYRRKRLMEEAEATALQNETVRLTTYQNIVADLDERLQRAMQQMRDLEDEITTLRTTNRALQQENDALRATVEEQRRQIESLATQGIA